MKGGVTIASDELRVTVNPRVGGTIVQVTHLGTGLNVLGKVPWDPVDAPVASLAARDEPEWLTRFTGGWPVLFPNGSSVFRWWMKRTSINFLSICWIQQN